MRFRSISIKADDALKKVTHLDQIAVDMTSDLGTLQHMKRDALRELEEVRALTASSSEQRSKP